MSFRVPSLALLIIGLFLWGLGQIAILPPFEGFDERAHWSLIREIAASGSIPTLGQTYVDQAYEDYAGPHPYSSKTPYDHERTYATFFGKSDMLDLKAQPPRAFAPSEELNWQAQHPPLYYLLMGVVDRIISPINIVSEFFILRLASFGLALAGVVLGLFGLRRGPMKTAGAVPGFYAYPFMLPMFFPEFTRLTNDALCLFLVGLLAFLLSLWNKDRDNLKVAALIGLTLVLGLWTKAFFIPIAIVLAVVLGMRTFRAGSSSHERLALVIMFYPALILGGGWFLLRLAHFGSIGIDSVYLAQEGGLLSGLKEHFSLYAFGRSLMEIYLSFIWVGTWSLARVPYVWIAPLALGFLWTFALYLRAARERPWADDCWLPAWLLLAFGLGLLHHLFIGMALDGIGHTPGWYVHILVPFLAPALGVGLNRAWQSKKSRFILVAGLIYAAVFQSVVVWFQFALFTGCAVKGENSLYAFSDGAFCLGQLPLLIQRLAVLGWPSMALVSFGGTFVVALILSKRALLSRSSF